MIQKRYIKRLDMEVSPLGIGVMRLAKNGAYMQDAFRLIDISMSKGINYYDAAFIYQGSEKFIRRALVDKYPRESFIIADKLPVWLCKNRDDMERIFNTQLERLGVDYVDIYLLHALHKTGWKKAHEQGVLDFLEDNKKKGRIRKTGFSYHDKVENLPGIANAYDWDMAQLQINYYDWFIHDIKVGYEYLYEKGLPIVVMGPVGGGRFAQFPEEIESDLKAFNPNSSISSWAVRFCASLKGAAVVLSGMSKEEELRDNIRHFSPIAPLSGKEYNMLEKTSGRLQKSGAIQCSACRYCVDACPIGIDIPYIFQRYNDYKLFNQPISLSWAYICLVPASTHADKCIGCGKCSKICPQKINIPEKLNLVHERTFLLTLFRNADDFSAIIQEFEGKLIVLFGAGMFGKAALNFMMKRGLSVNYFCDNGSHLWGTEIDGVKVISPGELQAVSSTNDICVLIANQPYYISIKEQLEALGIMPVNEKIGDKAHFEYSDPERL